MIKNWPGEETQLSRKSRIELEKKLDGALNWASKSQQMGNLPKSVQEEAQEEDDKVGTNSKETVSKGKTWADGRTSQILQLSKIHVFSQLLKLHFTI